jgi:NAD-dependent histone deacetylase SIR2
MIAELRTISDAAEPTAFHRFLKFLDDQGKLFRVYTQNIDGLEARAGLTCGLDAVERPPKVAGIKRKRENDVLPPTPDSSDLSDLSEDSIPLDSTPPPESSQSSQQLPTPPPSTISKRTATTAAACRVIPLHGTMHTLTCRKCHHHAPLEGDYLETLARGEPIACPVCSASEHHRSVNAERSRGVGVLRVDVVLYGEEHVDALRIGEITHRDLMGPRPDLLLVVGTSLKVPGTKRLVRELAKVVRSPEPREGDVKTIYLNLDYPKPASDFRGVFDVWIKVDVQAATVAFEARSREVAIEEADRAKKRAIREANRIARGEAPTARPAKKTKGKKGVKTAVKKVATPKPKPPPEPRIKASFEWKAFPVEHNVFREPVDPDLPRTRHAGKRVGLTAAPPPPSADNVAIYAAAASGPRTMGNFFAISRAHADGGRPDAKPVSS